MSNLEKERDRDECSPTKQNQHYVGSKKGINVTTSTTTNSSATKQDKQKSPKGDTNSVAMVPIDTNEPGMPVHCMLGATATTTALATPVGAVTKPKPLRPIATTPNMNMVLVNHNNTGLDPNMSQSYPTYYESKSQMQLSQTLQQQQQKNQQHRSQQYHQQLQLQSPHPYQYQMLAFSSGMPSQSPTGIGNNAYVHKGWGNLDESKHLFLSSPLTSGYDCNQDSPVGMMMNGMVPGATDAGYTSMIKNNIEHKSCGTTASNSKNPKPAADADQLWTTSSIPVTTTSTTFTMPTTMVVNTTAVTATFSGCSQQDFSFCTTTVMSTSVEHHNEQKRKVASDTTEEVQPKCQIIESEGDSSKWMSMSPDEMMQKVLNEVMGLKSTMDNEVVGLRAKVENVSETMNVMQHDNAAWKQKLTALTSDVVDLKDSVEMAHNLINDEKNQRSYDIAAIKSEFTERTREQTQNLQLIKNQSSQIKNVTDGLKTIRNQVDKLEEAHKQVDAPMKELKGEVESMLGNVEFPVKRTIVAQHVWYKEGEDLFAVADLIVKKTLELDEITICNVAHKSGWESGSGLLKIELSSPDEVKQVLQNKSKLKKARAAELRNVFLRQSKKEEVLLLERNEDTILREMGVRDNFIRLSSGHLAPRNHDG